MKEVELKAWITAENEEKIQKFLDTHTVYIGKKEKKDRNFCLASAPVENRRIAFRLREEFSENATGEEKGKKFWVTEKTRHYSEKGVEMNDELEFEVSNGEAFEQFVVSQGFEMFYTKEKLVKQYTQEKEGLTLLFEQLKVPDLGKFLEVEIVCEEEDLERAEQIISNTFEEIDIISDIEKSPYVVLLGKGKV